MKKDWTKVAGLFLLALALCGCTAPAEETAVPSTVEPTISATVPEDGNPEDVTCKGSYTGAESADTVVASLEGAELTNGVLNAFYWAAVADYRAAEPTPAPDFDKPLDTQPCPADDSVNSWQQYFLKQALNNWHSAQALKLQGDTEGLEPEEAYQPNLMNHGIYLTDIPAMKYHYSYDLDTFHPNTLHQKYLEELPERLEAMAEETGYADGETLAREAFGASLEDVTAAAELYNRGYMYFTELSYGVSHTEEELSQLSAETGETLVTIRQILLVPKDLVEEDTRPSWEQERDPKEPVILEKVEAAQDGTVTCSEEAWAAGLEDAQELLAQWTKDAKRTEFTFAELARQNSADPGSCINGGVYHHIRQGQMHEALDAWCFAETRQPGDTTILRSDYGYHILYFCSSTTTSAVQREEDLTVRKLSAFVAAARETYPMTVDYEKITLTAGEGTVSLEELLYPDIAHERFPEAPLYLQQDYGATLFGGDLLRTNGCGITTLSMLASYMTDTELTPPEMCARYGRYSYQGTDGRIFVLEPPAMGFYCKEKTYEPPVAKQALEDGYMVVSLQHKGYWTRGGHYILLEKMNEDGTIQVRDSNIFNYGKLEGHSIDAFEWSRIPGNGSAYWIFEKKVMAIPACIRCGTGGTAQNLLADQYYLCEKCGPAMLRRSTYQTACVQ